MVARTTELQRKSAGGAGLAQDNNQLECLNVIMKNEK
jgi:hypothetical protein